jgi:outer membrane protein assembly factor BamE (lipoprotein component of BamABCDE complex)
MRIWTYIWLTLVVCTCARCGTASENKNVDNFKKLKLGMRPTDVLHIMGKPDATKVYEANTSKFFYSYKTPLGFSDRINVFFSNKDSVVVALGDGQ